MTDDKDAAIAAVLQRPFLPNEIGKLPRGGTQLDYVGHADVTRRLLEADPDWNWEPLATDEHGLPVYDTAQNGQPTGLWIKLTVGGVTRLGYGSVPASQSDAVKVLIGDALRNAAMRFGVALDLWAKGDRANPAAENPAGPAGHRSQRPSGPRDDSWRNAPPVNRPAASRPQNEGNYAQDAADAAAETTGPDPAGQAIASQIRDEALLPTTTPERIEALYAKAKGSSVQEFVMQNEHGDEETLARLLYRVKTERQGAAAQPELVPAAANGNGHKP